MIEIHNHPTDEDAYTDRIAAYLLEGGFLEDGERLIFERNGDVISSAAWYVSKETPS